VSRCARRARPALAADRDASDRSGLLYSPSPACWRANQINLQLAKVTTLGERVEDTFLVNGPALQQPKAQLRIESELLDAVAPGGLSGAWTTMANLPTRCRRWAACTTR
jgi:UTP:GlnB (protein PII) uridylyltransferase